MSNLSMQDDVKVEELSTGGGSFLWDTGIYDCVVDMAYFDKSAERNTGKVINRAKEVVGGSTATAAKPAGKKLFN
jgi:hypothetical protein